MTTIHVIQSVKGGSGKTAFALRKVLALCQSENGEETKQEDPKQEELNEKAKVIYVDADVHASETFNMLCSKTSKMTVKGRDIVDQHVFYFGFSDENGQNKAKHFFNTYMHPYRGYYSKLNDMILHGTLKEYILRREVSTPKDEYEIYKMEPIDDSKSSGKADFIFADPSKEGRKVFKSQFQSEGKSAIGIGFYLAKIRSLFKFLLDDKSQYKDIVVDMPPGSDTFSEHLTEELINFINEKNHGKSPGKWFLNLYYVAGDDNNHMNSAIHAAVEHLHIIRSDTPIQNYFIYNAGRENNKTMYNSRETIIKKLKMFFDEDEDSIKEWCEYELKRLEYKSFDRDEVYYECLHNGVNRGLVVFDAIKNNIITDLQ